MIQRYCAPMAVVLLLGSSVRAAEQEPERIHPSGITILASVEEDTPAALPEDVAQALDKAMKLSANNPDDLGYPWADRTTNTVVMVATTQAGELLAGKLKAALAKRSGADLIQPAAAARHSRRYLERVMDEVIGLQPEGVFVQSAFPDPEHGRILIEVTKLDDEFLSRAAKTWEPSALAVRVVEEHLTFPVARNNDTSAFWGGANIGCTTGFSWHDGSTQMMLTAGHCYPTGGSVSTPAQFMGSVRGDGSEESWNAGTGTVLMTGQTTYRGDIALIRLTSGTLSAGIMYQGPAGSNDHGLVREMWSRGPASGDQYCTGGAQSGEQCGWVVKSSAAGNYAYDTGFGTARRVWRGEKRGWCMRPGDSGGPVYTVRSDKGIAAKGIISGACCFGGDDYFAGALDAACRNVFTDIWDAYNGEPGFLTLY